MTREEYISIFSNKIKRLPKEDYEREMALIIKRFDDAGEGNEQSVISELGDPYYAGDKVILDLAVDNGNIEENVPIKNVKGNLNALWIGILAVLACPIALPLAIVVLCALLAIGLSIATVLIAFGLVGIVLVLAVPVLMGLAALIAKESTAAFLLCVGAVFLCLGLGCMLTYGTYILLIALIRQLVHAFGDIAMKGGRKHE